MTALPESPARPGSPLTRRLETAALAVLLVAMTARCFMAEASFRTSGLLLVIGGEGEPERPTDECIRVSVAMVLLAGAALWAAGQTLRRRVDLRGAGWAILLAAWAALALASGLGTADVRGGIDGWLEHLAVLLAGWVTMQLAADRRRFGLIVVVLAALGATLAAKGIYQSAVEIPQAIAEYHRDAAGRLAEAGAVVGDTKARMLHRRLTDTSSHGYFGLSNVFASLLLVVAGATVGVAIARIKAARADRRANPPRRGEVHLPTLAACLVAAAAALGAPAVLLTRSKGGIAAGALAVAVGAIVAWKGRALARRRRLAIGAAAGLAAGAILATVALGLVRGGLPSRSLQVRWEYWIGAARIIAEEPLLGVGAGNFGTAYLAHRLPAAAEAVKTAHNVIMDAVSAFGIVGGAAYLALLGWMLLWATRPAFKPRLPAGVNSAVREQRINDSPPRKRGVGVGRDNPRLPARTAWIALLSVTVLLARLLWTGQLHWAMVLLEGVFPSVVMAAMLLAMLWDGRRLSCDGPGFHAARVALACGLVGFVAHNLLTYSLWMPATATVFWIAAGAAAGRVHAGADVAAPARGHGRAVAVALAVALAAGWLAAGWLIWRPVWRSSAATLDARRHWQAGNISAALAKLDEAVRADPLDGIVAADLARAAMTAGHQLDPARAAARAAAAAELALQRQPSPEHAFLLATAKWYASEPAELLCAWRGRRGDLMALREQLTAALLVRPDNVPIANALAEVLHAMGDDRAAYDVLKPVIEQAGTPCPKDFDHLGDLAWWTGRPDEARTCWRRYLDLTAKAADARARSAAVAAMSQAVAMDPMNARLRMDLAEMLIAVRRPGDAAGQLARAEALDAAQPPDSDFRLNDAERADLVVLRAKAYDSSR